MNKVYTFNFGIIEVGDSYVKATMAEGITIEALHTKQIIAISEQHFPHKKFGYITHRKNSYSVNPIVYELVSKMKNLVGFAIVSENILNFKSSEFEKHFIKKPTQAFQKMEEAEQWIQELINDSQ